MLSEEEKNAIEDLKELSHYCSLRALDIKDKNSDTWARYCVSTQKVENLIEKQQAEIEFQKDINKTEKERHKKAEKSLKGIINKQNKIINKMGQELFIEIEPHFDTLEQCIEFYTNKVEEENK